MLSLSGRIYCFSVRNYTNSSFATWLVSFWSLVSRLCDLINCHMYFKQPYKYLSKTPCIHIILYKIFYFPYDPTIFLNGSTMIHIWSFLLAYDSILFISIFLWWLEKKKELCFKLNWKYLAIIRLLSIYNDGNSLRID